MPLTNTETRDFQGLFLQQNSFNVPDGAFEEAMNVMIQSDGIISKVRGFYTYYTPPGPNEEIHGLFEFEQTLLCAFPTQIAFFTDDPTDDTFSPVGIRTNLTGDSITISGQSRSAKQSLNLYFTTDFGIFKLEDYAGKVRRSGVPPALDLFVAVGTAVSGPLPPDSQNAWRVVFGRRDENGNLLLGSPSDIATLGIPADGTGLPYTRSGGGPWTVTVTLPSNSGWVTGQQILVTNGSDPDVNGTQTITVVALSATNISFSVAADPGASGTLDISFSRTANLTAAIPSEIDDLADAWFVRFYRSTASAGLAVSPSPDFALVGEQLLTQLDITNRYVEFEDDVDPSLVGGQLYTNPNSREGEAQANARAPSATDITLYNTYMIYANVQTRQFLSLQLISRVSSSGYVFRIKLGATTETYTSVSGIANRTTAATSVAGVTTVTITYNAHGASNGWIVYISNVAGSVPRGTYTVSGVTANTFNITSTGNTATALDFEFISDGTSGVFYADTTSASVGQQIANTADYLVKAINRNSTLFYANYVSTFDDAPGKIRLQTKTFEPNSNMSVSDNGATPVDNAWIPPVPLSFASGTQVYADNNSLPDAIYFSKSDEPEAVPAPNFIRIGSKNKAIRRIFALRDCLVVLKEDGVFVLTGQTIADFNVSTLDATVFFISDRTADKINNTVIALSNQGLVQVTEKSVQIISRRMDDVIQPILGSTNLLNASLGFGYETARTYFLSLNQEVLGRSPQTYMYNVLNQTWTETDNTFRQMLVGPSDICYGTSIDENNVILRQRKSQTLVDFSREFMTGTAIATDLLTVTITLGTGGTAFTPADGDVIVYNEVINRIRTFDDDGLGAYTVTLASETNIPTSGSPVDVILYQGFLSTVKMAPFHAGAVGREKQFSSFQLHLRQDSISEINLSWASAYFGSSEAVDWSASLSSGSGSQGWGFLPWGLFPWGLADSIRLMPGTASGSIIRTWVAKFAQRTPWIAAVLNHRQACELMLIQSLSYAVRGYGDRTSR